MSRAKMPNPIAGQSRIVTLQYHPTDTTRADWRGWSVDALILKPLPFFSAKIQPSMSECGEFVLLYEVHKCFFFPLIEDLVTRWLIV
jgi:hypothetical protein